MVDDLSGAAPTEFVGAAFEFDSMDGDYLPRGNL
jgi:hypothetical protein